MAVKFRCAKCGEEVQADAFVGATVNCPHCNAFVVASEQAQAASPETSEHKPDADLAPGAEAEEQPEPLLLPGDFSLPSWGASLALHAALVLLCIFMVWHVRPTRTSVIATTLAIDDSRALEPSQRHETAKPKLSEENVPYSGTLSPKIEQPDTPEQMMVPISIIDFANNRRCNLDDSAFAHRSDTTEGLFASPGAAGRIIYIIDRSGSMTEAFKEVKAELKRSIKNLSEKNHFHVIFFSSAHLGIEKSKSYVEMPTRRPVLATEHNKKMAYAFIDSIEPQGGTEPADAIALAFALQPELIHLLTDGELDPEVIEQIAELNPGKRVIVNTIKCIYQEEASENVLKQIAKQNRGTYKFVSEKDLAALVQEGG